MIFILDSNCNRIGIIDSWVSLSWTEFYNEPGMFTLVLNNMEGDYNQLLSLGNFVVKDYRGTAMVIQNIIYDHVLKTITVNGYSVADLLNQRIAKEVLQFGVNNARELKNMLIKYTTGLESVLDLSQLNEGLGGTFYSQHAYEPLGSILTAVTRESGFGFKLTFDEKNSKKHKLEFYKGRDFTLRSGNKDSYIFGEERGNLKSLVIEEDMSEYKNTAYVLGEETEDYPSVSVEAFETKFIGGKSVEQVIPAKERREVVVDGSDIERGGLSEAEYKLLLKARGWEALNEYPKIQTFTVEVEPTDFRILYDLGDLVTCYSKQYNLHIDTRIVSYTELIENGNKKLELSLGTAGNNVITELKRMYR